MDENFWGKEIRRGDIFYVDGYGYIRADDTGVKAPWGVQGRNRADLLVATKQQAYSLPRYARVWYVGRVSKF